jgi:hypothetical protein
VTLSSSIAANATSYLDSTASASTTYTYTIKAVDNSGNPSSVVTSNQVTTPPGTGQKPATPTGLQSDLVTPNFIDLTWDASSSATSYTVTRTGPGNQTQQFTTASTSFGDNNGLTPLTSYTYTVAATNSAGSSNPTSGLTVKTKASPTTTLIGDISGLNNGKPDGYVDGIDLAILLANYVCNPLTDLTCTSTNPNSPTVVKTYYKGNIDDTFNTGIVDGTDLGVMLSNWTGGVNGP